MQTSPKKRVASIKYRVVASSVLLPMLAACGYKGPLYMPPPPPEENLSAPPQSSTPTPDAADSETAEPIATPVQ